ncbi:MAG: AtpZ/AtpI family protein [Actinomycetes bacterium]
MSESPDPSGEDGSPITAEEMSALAQFATLGTTLAGTVSAGLLAGLGFDHFFSTSPIGLFVGLGLGISGAVAAMVRLMSRWM